MDPREEGTTRLGETLTPIIDMWEQPEFFFLRDEKLLASNCGQAAVAGEFSACAIINPSGSGQLVVVDRVLVRVTAATNVLAGFALQSAIEATLGTLIAVFGRDTRLTLPNFQATPGQGVATSTLRNGSDPATAFVVSQFENRLLQTANVDTDLALLPVIVEPGFGYVVIGATVNVGVSINAVWRERKVQPAEQ